MDEVTAPTYEIPTSPAKPSRKLLVAVFVVGLVLLLLGCSVAAYFFYKPFTKVIDGAVLALSVPQDLRSVHFFVGDNKNSKSYHLSNLGLKADSGTGALTAIESTSPDGANVVVSYKTPSDQITQLFTGKKISPNDWNIVLRNVSNPEGAVIAHGYAPVFVDNTHISYFSVAGVVMYDLTTKSAKLVFKYPEGSMLDSKVQYSPDHSLVMWSNKIGGDIILSRISASSFTNLRTFKRFTNPILTNTNLYELRKNPKGPEIWRHAVEGDVVEKVTTIPVSLGVNSLLP
ncbi:MAG: hypothetical protein AB203_01660 [Parcubacteria bacterium C7867-008]|nr:MAG: hypothetical protein AB203_01660 [Parcubacteria bacterium C7867-008]